MNIKSLTLPISTIVGVMAMLISFHVWLSDRFGLIDKRFNELSSEVLVREANMRTYVAARDDTQRAIDIMQKSIAEMRQDIALIRASIQKDHHNRPLGDQG